MPLSSTSSSLPCYCFYLKFSYSLSSPTSPFCKLDLSEVFSSLSLIFFSQPGIVTPIPPRAPVSISSFIFSTQHFPHLVSTVGICVTSLFKTVYTSIQRNTWHKFSNVVISRSRQEKSCPPRFREPQLALTPTKPNVVDIWAMHLHISYLVASEQWQAYSATVNIYSIESALTSFTVSAPLPGSWPFKEKGIPWTRIIISRLSESQSKKWERKAWECSSIFNPQLKKKEKKE